MFKLSDKDMLFAVVFIILLGVLHHVCGQEPVYELLGTYTHADTTIKSEVIPDIDKDIYTVFWMTVKDDKEIPIIGFKILSYQENLFGVRTLDVNGTARLAEMLRPQAQWSYPVTKFRKELYVHHYYVPSAGVEFSRVNNDGSLEKIYLHGAPFYIEKWAVLYLFPYDSKYDRNSQTTVTDLRIFNRELTQEELRDIKNPPVTVVDPVNYRVQHNIPQYNRIVALNGRTINTNPFSERNNLCAGLYLLQSHGSLQPVRQSHTKQNRRFLTVR